MQPQEYLDELLALFLQGVGNPQNAHRSHGVEVGRQGSNCKVKLPSGIIDKYIESPILAVKLVSNLLHAHAITPQEPVVLPDPG